MVITPNYALIMALLICFLAELIQTRRRRAVSQIAFGPHGRARRWTLLAPALRIAALGLLTWGFLTLQAVGAKSFEMEEIPVEEMNRLLIAYDVSPSMGLKDAGPVYDDEDEFSSYDRRDEDSGKAKIFDVEIERYVGAGGMSMRKPITRSRRAAELIDSIMDRIQLRQTLISVVAFYTASRPVVVDGEDPAVIRNIFNELPLRYAFAMGKTNVAKGLVGCMELAAEWPSDSTTLLVITDGGTESGDPLPALPPSISNVVIVGVGRNDAGTYIDGHASKQEHDYLINLAERLQGAFYDGNLKHVPTESFVELAEDLPGLRNFQMGARECAILAIAIGAFLLGLLPVALAAFGSPWRTGRGARKESCS